ncbi:MAG: hypothetical protein WCJ64_20560, partial [Rhodospirillaceae bacterium]
SMIGLPHAAAITRKIKESKYGYHQNNQTANETYTVIGLAFERTHAAHMRNVMDKLKKTYGAAPRIGGFKERVIEISNNIPRYSVEISITMNSKLHENLQDHCDPAEIIRVAVVDLIEQYSFNSNDEKGRAKK